MAHPLRWYQPNVIYEATTRTIQERFLLRPSAVSRALIIGVLGRAMQLYTTVQLYAFVFLSNHYHLLASAADPEELALFFGFVNGNIAREMGRLHDWTGALWGRRVRPIPILDPEATVGRLWYVSSNGVKEGLVPSPRQWPGATAVHGLLGDMRVEGVWVDRDELRRARVKDPLVSADAFSTTGRGEVVTTAAMGGPRPSRATTEARSACCGRGGARRTARAYASRAESCDAPGSTRVARAARAAASTALPHDVGGRMAGVQAGVPNVRGCVSRCRRACPRATRARRLGLSRRLVSTTSALSSDDRARCRRAVVDTRSGASASWLGNTLVDADTACDALAYDAHMLTLVLDRMHSVLLDDGRLPDIPLDGPRPMKVVKAAIGARGIELPAPAGSRARADGVGRDFAFVIDRIEAPSGMEWRPVRDLVARDVQAWELYVELMLGGWTPPTRAIDVWSFGDRPEMAAQLVHLVACGAKRVTMGWIDAARRDGTPLAYEGGVSVVTDGFGYPRVVLRSVEVREMAFSEVRPEDAAGEGEGDLTYEDWRDGHTAYFTREAAKLGMTFDDQIRLAVERFEVLQVVGRADR